MVSGSTIQIVNAVRDIDARLKTLVGSELTKHKGYENSRIFIRLVQTKSDLFRQAAFCLAPPLGCMGGLGARL